MNATCFQTNLSGSQERAFFCDEMVIRLAKWLRAAGYEAHIPKIGEPDRLIKERVHNQSLLLLTKDKELAQRAKDSSLLLTSNSLSMWVKQLNHQKLVDWHHQPFSRCLCCGGRIEGWQDSPLQPKAPAWVLERYEASELLCCPFCQKTYWKGSHYKKVKDQLAVWSVLR